MGDFDVESKGDAEQRDRLFVDTLAQKIDTELRNPDVNWASKRDATRDPGSDFILRRAVSGGAGGSPTIDGDLDMLMYDILNIDTLRFKSDSPFHITSDKAQIRSNLLGEELNFYVPTGKSHLFYIGNTIEMSLSSAINTLRSDVRFDGNVRAKRNVNAEGNVSVDGNISTDGTIDADGKITTAKEIKVGSKTGTLSDGMIWYEANKLKARINGETVNLGEGEAAPTPPGPDEEPTTPTTFSGSIPSGAFYVPVEETVTSNLSNSDASAGVLDNKFGTFAGACGLIRPALINDDTPVGDLRLCYKMWHGAGSGDRYSWSGEPMDGVMMNTESPPTRIRSTLGARSKQLTYVHKKVFYQRSSSSQAPSSSELSTAANIGIGSWGIHAQTIDVGDGSIFAFESVGDGQSGSRPVVIGYERLDSSDELGTTASGALEQGIQNTPGTLPALTMSNWPTSAASIEPTFGIDDGYIGYVYSTVSARGRIYVKANGYWFYVNLTREVSGSNG